MKATHERRINTAASIVILAIPTLLVLSVVGYALYLSAMYHENIEKYHDNVASYERITAICNESVAKAKAQNKVIDAQPTEYMTVEPIRIAVPKHYVDEACAWPTRPTRPEFFHSSYL